MPEGLRSGVSLSPERAALDFARRLPDSAVMAVALSGGGDSVGLLVALHEAFRSEGRGLRLTAVTVDHALRPGSAAEAEAAAAICRAFGITHETVTWAGEKPRTALMEAARAARYRLLADCCVRLGATGLVTAHTLDDQLETVEMRTRRGGAQARGLSGMAPASLYFGRLWAYRPFLAVRRSDIRRLLRDKGVDWLEDPSNDNPRFERVRVRQGSAFKLDAREIADRAWARADMAAAAADLCHRHVTAPLPLLFSIEGAASETMEAFDLLMRALISVAGGQPHLPSESQTHAVLSHMMGGGRSGSASLGRTVIDWSGGRIHICRDRRNLPVAASGDPPLWDNRFLKVAEPGLERSTFAATQPTVSPPPRVMQRALDSLPPGMTAEKRADWVPVFAPYSAVLPSFDLPLANAIARVAGCPPFPEPISRL